MVTLRYSFGADALDDDSHHLWSALHHLSVVTLEEQSEAVDDRLVLVEVLLQRQTLKQDGEHLRKTQIMTSHLAEM